MARAAGLSHSTIGRIWRTFRLQPHRVESFKLSPDPQLIDKIRDVVGLYTNPPTNAVVFAVDEKSQMQALERAQPVLPMDLGQPERRTHNYLRHGTLDLFAALNVATGEVLARCTAQHRAQDFVAFLREIEASVEPMMDIQVVLDNLSAHKAPPVQRWLLRHPRLQFPSRRPTPRGSTWWSASSACSRRRHRNEDRTRALRSSARPSWRTSTPTTTRDAFKWVKSADEILDSMRRFGLRVQQVHGQ